MTKPVTPSPIPARARGRHDQKRKRLAELTGKDMTLTHEMVPALETRLARIKWIVQRLNRGLWLTEHAQVLAETWLCTVGAVREYAHVAAAVVEITGNDIETMAREAAQRIVVRGETSEDERLGNEADKLILQLTGHLKGGRDEQPSMTAAEREQAIIDSIANPDDAMERILREAFSRGSDRLRGILAEHTVLVTEGVTR